MINLVKVISTSIINNKTLVKVLRYGKNDVQTPKQITPYGIDSNPVKDMIAVYAKCGSDNNNVVIGYINKNSIAKVGEMRLFSTDKDGIEKFYYYLKGDGTTEIGGNGNFAVKYNELKTEFNKLKDTTDDLVQKWNSFCSLYTPGSPSSLGTPPTLSSSTVSPNMSDITQTKNDKIKTIG